VSDWGVACPELRTTILETCTPRETDALKLRARGLSLRSIALELRITESAVRSLLARGFPKVRRAVEQAGLDPGILLALGREPPPRQGGRRRHLAEELPQLAAELTRGLRGQADHGLLQLSRRNRMLREQAKVLGEALLADDAGDLPVRPGSAPLDAQALRGIPAVGGRGQIGGAIRGTSPLPALLAKEANERRRRP
jgi:hypothetical protein